jgi:hypothetical protein
MRETLKMLPLALCALLVELACHSKLPPTQPPRHLGVDPSETETRTNDLPPGPVATEPAPPVTPAPPGVGGGTGTEPH